MIRRTIFLLAFLLPVSKLVTGQDSEIEQFRATMWMANEVTRFDLSSTACPDPPPNVCDYRMPVISKACRLDRIDSLGIAQEVTYHLKRYLFTTTFQDTEDEEWTCEADGVLVLQEGDDSIGTLVWSGATERTYEFIRNVTLADHGQYALLSVQYCVNGTGGCVDRLFLSEDGSWQPLERDSTWEAVARQFPGGYRPHKSPPIDIVNLTWEQHLAGPNDANCCPSGKVFLELDVINGKLSIRTARLSADLFIE